MIEKLDAVGDQGRGVVGEAWGELVDGLRGAGFDEKAFDRRADRVRPVGGGFAADFSAELAFDVESVGGVRGGRPVEMDLVADALGSEVGDGPGKVERWRPGRTGARAGDEQRQQQAG